jgi:cytidylate kinase
MTEAYELEHLVGALERAQRHWDDRRREAAASPAAVPPPLTIALSRQAGTPGTSVAREVGARLGWPVYDHELLQRIAQEMGLRVRLLESVDERRQSWLRECIEAFASAPVPGEYVSESAFVRQLTETVLSLGTHGECVIVGRGAAQLLAPQITLRVRLVGMLADRVAAVSRRFGLSPKEAERRVQEIERERLHFVRAHFHKDPVEPANYDLILNSSRWSVAECAELVIQAARALQVRMPATAKAVAT